MDYTKESKEWVADWSHNLAEIMDVQNKESIDKVLNIILDGETDIDKVSDLIQELGVRNTKTAARTVGATEVRRIDNVAKQEAMRQNPAVTYKKWRHSGNPKHPRSNHVAMDGISVPKDEPFNLVGIKGGLHHPMAPHDPILPVEEVVHCGCSIAPVIDKEIKDKSANEKHRMQVKAIDEFNDDWEKEFNERNKKASGIDFERVKIDSIRKKSDEEQIKYFGGGKICHAGKARKALLDTGIISTDAELNNLYKITPSGKRVLKTLQELEEDGIMTIRKATLNHVTKGDFTNLRNPNKPPGNGNGGRPKGGFHSASSRDVLENKGFKCHIEKTYDNGVKIGSIKEHSAKDKKYDKDKKVTGQSWFPDDWSDDDILRAGTYVANKGKKNNNGIISGNYKGVKIMVVTVSKPGTIYPDVNQNS